MLDGPHASGSRGDPLEAAPVSRRIPAVSPSSFADECDGGGSDAATSDAATHESSESEASEVDDAFARRVSWIPEEGVDESTTTIDQGDDAWIDTIASTVVSSLAPPEDETTTRLNSEEESTVSDLASSVTTSLEDSDDWERSPEVWKGHGILIDLDDGVDVSEESAIQPSSMPSTELLAAKKTDRQVCRHTTGSTASKLSGSQRGKVGEIRFGRPTRISLDDDISRTLGNSVRIQGSGHQIDKSPTLEGAQKNIATGNSVAYVRRDSHPEPTTFVTSYMDVSENACGSVDEEMGKTAAVEVRSRWRDCMNGGPVFLTASGCALVLFLVAVVSAGLAGVRLSKMSSKEPYAVAAIESTAPPAYISADQKQTISPTATPTIQMSMTPSPGAPETNEPTVEQACQLVTIRVKYNNATIIGWTLVETADKDLLFDEGTYVDSFYSSDPDVASQPQVTEDCLKSGSYRWFTYGDGEGSYSLGTPSGTLVEGAVEFRGNVAFAISYR
ncbi:hypothetical protein THAOC_16175 [Thalassiosira oceanica]|uniref:Uncharacterized protein n=1 Tax=Thalassiosira oceanica TaxID=159749 RepID=K0SE26_THAOC|nr:hypothetical protein THAOC_16175 [Thalassiosira oceanica]|eukprot:EJK63184.1 hypothetical protein THAOC_16175 [Thalassiosira oceanica]